MLLTFNYKYQYHLQAAKVVDYRLHVNNKRRADETEAEDQEQYLTHYEPLIIEKWALRLLKADKNRTIISTEPIARIDVEDAGCEICCDPGTREEHRTRKFTYHRYVPMRRMQLNTGHV